VTYEEPAKSLEYLQTGSGSSFRTRKRRRAESASHSTRPSSRTGYTDQAVAVNANNLDGLFALDFDGRPNPPIAAAFCHPARTCRPGGSSSTISITNTPKIRVIRHPSPLLLTQLEELLKLRPGTLTEQHFVVLSPQCNPRGRDWRHDPQVLKHISTGSTPLPGGLSSQFAPGALLYHRPAARGKYDKEKFLEYLKLPRHVGYASKAVLESEALKRFPCDLNAIYEGATLLSAIGNDEPLVRSYLAHFFVDAASTKEFEPYINDIYLKHLLAEVKIVNGLGNAEQWASLLPPCSAAKRIDIDLPSRTDTISRAPWAGRACQRCLHADREVFEINTRNYYRERSCQWTPTSISTSSSIRKRRTTTRNRRCTCGLPFRLPDAHQGRRVRDRPDRTQQPGWCKGRLYPVQTSPPAGLYSVRRESQAGQDAAAGGARVSSGEGRADRKIPFSTNPAGRPSSSRPLSPAKAAGRAGVTLDFFSTRPSTRSRPGSVVAALLRPGQRMSSFARP
jgi:hypothetical protein